MGGGGGGRRGQGGVVGILSRKVYADLCRNEGACTPKLCLISVRTW